MHHAVADRRPAKRILFEPFPKKPEPGSVPGQNLQPVCALRAEDDDHARKGIALKLLARQSGPGCRRRAGSPPASSQPEPARPTGTAIMSPPSRREAPRSASQRRSPARREPSRRRSRSRCSRFPTTSFGATGASRLGKVPRQLQERRRLHPDFTGDFCCRICSRRRRDEPARTSCRRPAERPWRARTR